MDDRPTPSRLSQDAPGDPVRHTSSLFGRVTQALNIVGTILILVMAIAVNSDVAGRNFFNHPIPGVTEFLGLSIVAIVFLQMANTLREGRHVSNDLLTQWIAGARPRLKAAIYAAFNSIGAVLMVLIAVYVWPIFMQNYEGGYYRGATGVAEIPIWPFMAAVLVGAVATAIQFVLLMLEELRKTATGSVAP
jgi:TRAP-type C4-dicarboxylate transport system permease small subunit